MPKQMYPTESLRKLLKRKKIATMPELKEVLGTAVDVTVFRKLSELCYRTSYSDRGRYYTLDDTVRFDEMGLWSFREVWFSQYGTLLSTAEAIVGESEAGYSAEELKNVLHVGAKDALRKLFGRGVICREKVSGRYIYLSCEPCSRKEQWAARQVYEAQPSSFGLGGGLRVIPDELKAAIVLFCSLLDEKQRRLYAGLEALKMGHGGDQKVADLLGLDLKTIAKGRRQLLQHDVEVDRVRATGGGRIRMEKKRRRSSSGSKRS